MIAVTPNIIAYAALFSWPIVAAVFFSKMTLSRAVIWTILGGFLLLPVGTSVKIEMIPAFDKNSVPALAAFVGCLCIAPRLFLSARGSRFEAILLLAFVCSPIVTSLFNQDARFIGGGVVLPGVDYYDGISGLIAQFITIVPFVLGRNYLFRADDTVTILRALITSAIVYSLPMLFEVRMSPQLHTWIYGYFPHEFQQQIRDGGFRPVVFIGHGLLVAFFAATAVGASSAFWRLNIRVFSVPASYITLYLLFVLVLCKSVASILYGFVLLPLIRFASFRFQFQVAVVLAFVALSYPITRSLGLFPTETVLAIADGVSEERSLSLRQRFTQEDSLLAHAEQKAWFGWGRWGRSRVYNEWGQDVTVTDGRWIIVVGTYGLVGFIAEFGLLALVILRAARATNSQSPPEHTIGLCALSLIVAINMLDLLPNSSISPWTWLLAGALSGRSSKAQYPQYNRVREGRAGLLRQKRT